MIAHLGMYDMPELRPSNDLFWTAIRDHLGFGPTHLTRDGDAWDIWQSPDLLFSQTCGMPYRTHLRGKVNLIGTPDYALKGCPAGHYCSVIIVRKDAQGERLSDFDGQRFAYNEALSQSGWAAPKTLTNAEGLRFADHIATGGHAASAKAVADGTADIAGIDALTWELLKRHDSITDSLQVLTCTPPTPVLPYITSLTQDQNAIARAVRSAIADLPEDTRSALHLQGLVDISSAQYCAVMSPPAPPTQ